MSEINSDFNAIIFGKVNPLNELNFGRYSAQVKNSSCLEAVLKPREAIQVRSMSNCWYLCHASLEILNESILSLPISDLLEIIGVIWSLATQF
ncbi:hypothetical protein [Pseudovibrio sp. Ad37]|uniref:hypothetical protein n=1 Tax=Pseudovibrio sp. Ad37 TaxID=989422 RepID=UPI0007AE6B9D|nr:hypothetical protein [Pseudovibrio sp. Ad37]